jgi:predicted Holliday junction resolvase-like endonuclease
MFWLYLGIILASVSVMGIILYFMLKRLSQPIIIEKERVIEKQSSVTMERAVREGMKSAIREMESEKQIQKEIDARLKRKDEDMGVYASTDDSDAPVKRSGGNLVPFGLSDEEKKILNMFYND